MKFSIEYKRTVRVRKYETLTIGYMEEFDTNTDARDDAFSRCSKCVNEWIDQELEWLQGKDDVQA